MTGVANSSAVGGVSQEQDQRTTSADSESKEAQNRAGGSFGAPKKPTQTDQQNHQPLQPDGGFQPDPVEPELSARCDHGEGVPNSSQVESLESLESPAAPSNQTAPAAPITMVKTAKPAVVIVFDVDRWQARLAGGRPILITESLLDQARNDLYYCFKNTAGEVLKFARSRRDPTPVQRLALVVRDERCVYPGCHTPPESCDAHHTNEVVKDRGFTNVEVMALFCRSHHRHIHLNDLVVIRETNGTITVKKRNTGAVAAQTVEQKRAA
jgi:hypothetical protein